MRHRYPLNKSQSTWIEIGIRVKSTPVIEIALINKRSEEIIFTEPTWMQVMNLQNDINRYFDPNLRIECYDIDIDNINIHYTVMNQINKKAIGFRNGNKVVYILKDTCNNMYKLQYVIQNMREYLHPNLAVIKDRYKIYAQMIVNAQSIDINEIQYLIINSPHYNRRSLIDTEMVALCLEDIASEKENNVQAINMIR